MIREVSEVAITLRNHDPDVPSARLHLRHVAHHGAVTVCFERDRVRSGERGSVRLYCTPEYLERLSEDPWGCRYAINTGLLGNGTGLVTLALSAGPNCIVETPFRMTGLSIPGDDLVGLLSSGH